MLSEEKLRTILQEFFEERARVDAATHGIHHEWIAAKIERERVLAEMYRTVTKAAVSWSIPVLLGAVWYFFQHGKWPGG